MPFFNFKYFSVNQTNSSLKIGTDAMLLGALVDYTSAKFVLDIGTGTGVLALIAAQFTKNAFVDALEIDKLNFNLSVENFENSPWSSRLQSFHSDLLDFDEFKKYDLIISNPPYYENAYHSNNKRVNKAKHNTSLTPEILFKKVSELGTVNLSFWCILPSNHNTTYLEKAKEYGFYIKEEISIFGKPNILKRIVYCFCKTDENYSKQELTIRNADNSYTEEYKKLTQELHDREL